MTRWLCLTVLVANFPKQCPVRGFFILSLASMLANNINNNNNDNNNNNNNNKIFITVSMYLAHRANWGHLLLQN